MLKSILTAGLLAVPLAASAQAVLDVSSLTAIDDIDVVSADGSEIGDVEEGLIGPDGSLVALVVEFGGFLDIGDEDRVIAVDQLRFENGDFVTDLVQDDFMALPEWDD